MVVLGGGRFRLIEVPLHSCASDKKIVALSSRGSHACSSHRTAGIAAILGTVNPRNSKTLPFKAKAKAPPQSHTRNGKACLSSFFFNFGKKNVSSDEPASMLPEAQS